MLSGHTPLVKITYRLDGVTSSVYAKLEFFNPSGSIKDRVAEFVVERASASGELQPGQPLVEVTSGNTGIAFAAVGARTGHPVHLFMPEWASDERKRLMRMYGATLHEVSREEGGFAGAFALAERLAKELSAYCPRQFENEDNALAHSLTTGPELLSALPGITDFVAGVGSGGTLMGVARALRAAGPVRVTAIEPDSVPLLTKGVILGPHKIEGIGDDFVPPLLDRRMIDGVLDLSDNEAVYMAARLAKELGLGVGISSGANFLGAVRLNAPGRTVATVFADDNKKYLSTVLAEPVRPQEDSPALRLELMDVSVIK